MHNVAFLQDMAVVMATSALVTVLFHQLRLPVVLGYILAGVIIGPHTPPFPLITNIQSIETLSELGVILLLFGIGLEFSFNKLLKVGLVSIAAGTLELLLTFWIGFTVGKVMSWSYMDSLFLGAILSISSTTIIAKILLDSRKFQEQFAQIIMGILVIEDILAIIIIAVLSGLASTGEISFASALTDMMKVGGFISGVLLVGALIAPKLLSYVASFDSSEMMMIAVLGMCFGVSLLAAKLGFSVALGAFLIGAVIAETQQSRLIVRQFEPIRDMFTAVFFVSVGLLFDPHVVYEFKIPILILTVVTILAKVFGCSFAVFLTGNSPSVSMKVGLGMAQIGEFSFIIAQLGESTRATSMHIFPIAVAVSVLTTITAPFRMTYSESIIAATAKMIPKPIMTFVGLYHGWIIKIRQVQGERSRKPLLISNVKSQLPRILFYLLSLFGVVRIAPGIIQTLSIPEFWGQLLLILAMMPFLLGLFSVVDAILWQTFLQPFIIQRNSSDGHEAQNALHQVMRFAVVVILGLAMPMIAPIFLPSIPVGYILLGVLVISASVIWGSVQKIHQRIENKVLGFFEHETLPQDQAEVKHDELLRLIQTKYPWGVETQDFMLPLNESKVNCPIKELRLRELTGVTIIAIYRDERAIINPVPETVLLPGDVLLLMGNKEQLGTSVNYLNAVIKGKGPSDA